MTEKFLVPKTSKTPFLKLWCIEKRKCTILLSNQDKAKMTDKEKTERKIVIPGEIIVEGEDYLPGDGTEKKNGTVVAVRYGLAEEQNNLVKVIPLSGAYIPRRGNVIIAKVESINFNGWIFDIGAGQTGFLSLTEVPRYVDKNGLDEVLSIGDMAVVKVWNINTRGIDLSLKSRGLGKIEEGMIVKVNPNKVPRIIGKEGSMIKLIKDNTNCNITVGQNGFIWIQGDSIEDELLSKKAIMFIAEKSSSPGLTEEVEKFFNGRSKSKPSDETSDDAEEKK